MITPASIPYITRLLAEPAQLTETDATPVAEMVQMYPYFVPARYLEGALMYGASGHTQATAIHTRLYAGNWLLHQEYIKAAAGKGGYAPMPAQEAAPAYSAESYEVPDAGFTNNYATDTQAATEEVAPEANLGFTNNYAAAAETDTASGPVAGEPVEDAYNNDIYSEEPPNLEDELNDGYEVIEERPLETEAAAPEETSFAEATAKEEPKETKRPAVAPVQEHADDETLILPLYTEDYFMHQGFQVANDLPATDAPAKEDDKDTDQSLMVVMSFADWLLHFKNKGEKQKEEQEDKKALKSMWQKEKLASAMEEENEEIPETVFEMAVNSIAREEDLASEPLAEIHVKQGKYDAAIDMYKKLSLRNPQKSAYFARKIEAVLKEKHA